MKWLDKFPFWAAVLCALYALMPIHPMPHLVEKLLLLVNGQLSKGIDVIDLLLHGGAAAMVMLKIIRQVLTKI